jgi:hypothetical protein
MFRITARLSTRARTRPRRSPLTNVMPALSIATSVPVPIAIPTCALRLRERRRVINPVTGHRDLSAGVLQTLHRRRFLIGPHVRFDLGDAHAARDGFGGDPRVPCEHDDAHAVAP